MAPTGGTPQSDSDADHRAAEADDLLRPLHLMVDTHPTEQVGRVGTARGQKPAARVPATQGRRNSNPPISASR